MKIFRCRGWSGLASLFLIINLFALPCSGFENFWENGGEFDFIVAGGGTGGCVVAGRLAESGKHTVLLIEEGAAPNPNLEIPGLGNPQSLWNYPNEMKFYYSVPQQNAGLAVDGKIPFGIGKTLGGGSSVNGMFWNRGHPLDYNTWANLTGDESWNYSNMLKYFRASENYLGFNPTNQRGYGGPVTVRNQNQSAMPSSVSGFIQASQEVGYPFGDANGPQTASVNYVDFSQDEGRRRVSSYSSYIRPLLRQGRSNLVVLTNTEAKRVIFEGNRAVGVTYQNNGKSGKVGFARARKEIIVSAGVVDSAALLMRSGIGTEDVLRQANIPIVKKLPVGENFQDHVALLTTIIFGNRSSVIVPSRDLTPAAWKTFQERGEGPYSFYVGMGVQGFFLSSLEQKSKSYLRREYWPDLHFTVSGEEAGILYPEIRKEITPEEVSTFWGILVVRPKSVGRVTLNPEDPDGAPLVDFRYFSHPDDLQVMVDGLKLAGKLCEGTTSMQELKCRLPSTPLPACSHFKFHSDLYWECYAKQFSRSGWHGAGTCRMGSGPEDPQAVVDTQLRVIGIEGLRVADASVMPQVTNANTQTPVYAIAEKVSDLILKKWETSFN